jgi:predicted nucleic acid-binding protein
VVDTSLALKWVLPETHQAEALALLGDWQARQIVPTVPSWFACEVSNVLFQRVRAKTSTLPDAQRAVRDLLAAVTVQDFDPAVAVRGLELAQVHRQKASYDAHYLALAERLGCELWTADEQFWKATNPALPWVRWVGEVALP